MRLSRPAKFEMPIRCTDKDNNVSSWLFRQEEFQAGERNLGVSTHFFWGES